MTDTSPTARTALRWALYFPRAPDTFVTITESRPRGFSGDVRDRMRSETSVIVRDRSAIAIDQPRSSAGSGHGPREVSTDLFSAQPSRSAQRGVRTRCDATWPLRVFRSFAFRKTVWPSEQNTRALPRTSRVLLLRDTRAHAGVAYFRVRRAVEKSLFLRRNDDPNDDDPTAHSGG